MKHILPIFIVLFWSFTAASQTDFAKADSIALNFKGKYTDPADLARQLAQPFTTDAEKARVLFTWVADNIRYDVDKYENPPPRMQVGARTKEELEQKKKAAFEAELRSAFKSKRGVCQDYSQIYKAMCDAVGLECEVVRGDAREFFKPYRAVHDNPHAWNAVKIDGQWRLLDATWAAGYVRNHKFSKRLQMGHFMPPPAWFAERHLPDKPEWQLLETPISTKGFPAQALVNYGQSEYPLTDFSQNLEKMPNGDLRVRFKFSALPNAFMVVNGQSRKPIEFSQAMEDGYVVFQFSPRGLGDVALFMGERLDEKMEWLAKYDIK